MLKTCLKLLLLVVIILIPSSNFVEARSLRPKRQSDINIGLNKGVDLKGLYAFLPFLRNVFGDNTRIGDRGNVGINIFDKPGININKQSCILGLFCSGGGFGGGVTESGGVGGSAGKGFSILNGLFSGGKKGHFSMEGLGLGSSGPIEYYDDYLSDSDYARNDRQIFG